MVLELVLNVSNHVQDVHGSEQGGLHQGQCGGVWLLQEGVPSLGLVIVLVSQEAHSSSLLASGLLECQASRILLLPYLDLLETSPLLPRN